MRRPTPAAWLSALALAAATLASVAPTPEAHAAPRAAAPVAAPTTLTGPELAASWTPPLSTRGRYVVDATGKRFKLESGNWEGAQGTWKGSGDVNDDANHHAGINAHDIPKGLDRVPMATLMADFHSLGINSIRLPFSNAMLHMTAPVPDRAVTANPQLRGLTPLQVFDEVVAALTADGFAVILNNHTTTSRFCCALDGNERWNSSQSTQQWIDDWVFLANRYRTNPRVVGADLRNEVRRDVWDDPNWTTGDDHDLFKAHAQAGRAIQRANPELLLVLEGINWYGIPLDGFDHGRPQLKPVVNLSHTFTRTDKVVYSAHFYGYTGPRHSGATGTGETHDWRYREYSPADLAQVVRNEAFVVHTADQHYTAPVWISEFGVGGRGQTNAQEMAWWSTFIDILIANDADFAVWPLVGATTNGVPNDSWALLSYAADGTRQSITDEADWRRTAWQRLVDAPSQQGPIQKPVRWNMLNTDYGDDNASALMATRPDWDSGAAKGTCPDSERLQGLSRSTGRALCTDQRQPLLTDVRVTVKDERYVTNGDWASGYSKLQCPANHVAVGFSERSRAMSGLLCAKANVTLSTSGRNVWFDRGDNRPAGGGSTASDWAPGYYKGQCADHEYVAGVAYTWRWSHGGVPDALLCRPLP